MSGRAPGLERRLAVLALRAAAGKRRSGGIARFLLDLDASCHGLAESLRDGSYRPAPGRAFRIYDPKPRLIHALPFRDRVVQHMLIGETLGAIERSMVAQSYACRLGMGTHRCLRRAADLHRGRSHLLRIDVRKFFPSIDHIILRRLLDRSTPLPLRWLRDRFLTAPAPVERADFHFPGDDLFAPSRRPHGLPIGSLTSQIWANVYLSPLDHLLASHLGLGAFVRYCDDVLVYDDDPGRLRAALSCITERANALRLRLHPGKTRVHRTTEPVPFLGFVLERRGDGVRVRLRTENVRRMRRRMRTLRAMYRAGALLPEDVTARLRAWLAHARSGHTRELVRRELSQLRFRRDE